MRWYLNNEEYEGNWQDGKPHGKGKLMYLNVSNETCNYYEGDFVNGQREGYGVFYYADGSKYEGCWQNNMKVCDLVCCY
ncbi:MORN repeat protein [compost metagenome]